MHEWALAQSVVYAALDHARKNNLGKITAVTVKVGELQSIDRECFDLALREMLRQEAPEAELNIEAEPATLECRACGRTWTFAESKSSLPDEEAELIHLMPDVLKAYVKCPTCGSPDYAVTGGRGVTLESVEGA